MAKDVAWDVTMNGHTVRIHDYEGADLSEADAAAVLAATEELLIDDEVSLIQVNGPELHDGQPPKAFANVVRSIDDLAHRHGKPHDDQPDVGRRVRC